MDSFIANPLDFMASQACCSTLKLEYHIESFTSTSSQLQKTTSLVHLPVILFLHFSYPVHSANEQKPILVYQPYAMTTSVGGISIYYSASRSGQTVTVGTNNTNNINISYFIYSFYIE